MDEVMVLGDSLNDYSMISMDFGATVAMEKRSPEIKKAAKYITKSNNEFWCGLCYQSGFGTSGKIVYPF